MIRAMLKRRRFMRDHAWVQPRLSSYLDDELPAPERERVEHHAGLCPECRRAIAALRRMLESLRGLSAAPDANLRMTIIRRLREE